MVFFWVTIMTNRIHFALVASTFFRYHCSMNHFNMFVGCALAICLAARSQKAVSVCNTVLCDSLRHYYYFLSRLRCLRSTKTTLCFLLLSDFYAAVSRCSVDFFFCFPHFKRKHTPKQYATSVRKTLYFSNKRSYKPTESSRYMLGVYTVKNSLDYGELQNDYNDKNRQMKRKRA